MGYPHEHVVGLPFQALLYFLAWIFADDKQNMLFLDRRTSKRLRNLVSSRQPVNTSHFLLPTGNRTIAQDLERLAESRSTKGLVFFYALFTHSS
jgi:hypothetical protein